MLRHVKGQHNDRRAGEDSTRFDDDVYGICIRVSRGMISAKGSDIPAHPPQARSDGQCDGNIDDQVQRP